MAEPKKEIIGGFSNGSLTQEEFNVRLSGLEVLSERLRRMPEEEYSNWYNVRPLIFDAGSKLFVIVGEIGTASSLEFIMSVPKDGKQVIESITEFQENVLHGVSDERGLYPLLIIQPHHNAVEIVICRDLQLDIYGNMTIPLRSDEEIEPILDISGNPDGPILPASWLSNPGDIKTFIDSTVFVIDSTVAAARTY